jgi:hypothetical protein
LRLHIRVSPITKNVPSGCELQSGNYFLWSLRHEKNTNSSIGYNNHLAVQSCWVGEPVTQNLDEFTLLTLKEAEPLLQIISRLGHIVLVKPSPYLRLPWPHMCWLSDPNVDAVNSEMWKFNGNAFWYLLSDMPRTCLDAEVRTDMLSEPVQPAIADVLLAKARADLPNLADFLEAALDLRNKPSLGYELSKRVLELPLVEDRIGSGRPVVITADPNKYAAGKALPTSDLDRTIHFWITEEDYDSLYATLEKEGLSSDYPLLRRIVTASYQNVAIQPNEIKNLNLECQHLRSELGQSSLANALLNIESVGRSAMNYNLGICVPGG